MMRPEDFDVTEANAWLAVTDEPDNARMEWADVLGEVEAIIASVEDGFQEADGAVMRVAQIVSELPVVREAKVDADGIVVVYDTTITWDAVEVLMFLAHMEYDSAYAHGHDEQTAKVAELWRYDTEFWGEVA